LFDKPYLKTTTIPDETSRLWRVTLGTVKDRARPSRSPVKGAPNYDETAKTQVEMINWLTDDLMKELTPLRDVRSELLGEC
jgi:hypothetical protein